MRRTTPIRFGLLALLGGAALGLDASPSAAIDDTRSKLTIAFVGNGTAHFNTTNGPHGAFDGRIDCDRRSETTTGTCSWKYQVTTLLTVDWYLLVEGGTICPGTCSGDERWGSFVIKYNEDVVNTFSTYLANPSSLTVSTSGDGSGTVTSVPAGIDCGAECFSEFPTSYPLWLTAAADPGSTFVRWAGEFQSTSPALMFTMSHATSLDARFELIDASTPAPTPATTSLPTAATTAAPTEAATATDVPSADASVAATEAAAATEANTAAPAQPAAGSPPLTAARASASVDPGPVAGIEPRASRDDGFIAGLVAGGALMLIAAAAIALWLRRRTGVPPASG